MSLVEKPFRVLYAVLFVVFALFGTSMTIIGATLPKILADFGWDYVTAGAIIAAGAIGYFVSIYVSGFLVTAIGPRLTMIAGLALDIVGLALFAIVPSPLANLVLYLGVGLGQGGIELVVNWCTLLMDRSASGRAMNLMHGAFAVGAFVGPFVIGMLMKASLPWTLIYRGISGLFALLALAMLAMPFGKITGGEERKSESKGAGLARHPAYWLGFLALLVYVGIELGVSNWVAEYFVTVFGVDAPTGSFMVSLFWAGLLAGRFGVPILYRGTRQGAVLMVLSLTMGVSVLPLALVGFFAAGGALFPVAAALVFLAGLGCSCVYPIVVTLLGGAFPEAQSRAIAFASTGGGIGSFAFPFLMSGISAAWGIRAGFMTYAVFSVILIVVCLALIESIAHKRKA